MCEGWDGGGGGGGGVGWGISVVAMTAVNHWLVQIPPSLERYAQVGGKTRLYHVGVFCGVFCRSQLGCMLLML